MESSDFQGLGIGVGVVRGWWYGYKKDNTRNSCVGSVLCLECINIKQIVLVECFVLLIFT